MTYATRTGRLPVLEYLSQFLHVDDEDGNGKTCLFVAAEMDQLDVAKYLVEEKNVNVYHVNKVQPSPSPSPPYTPLLFFC